MRCVPYHRCVTHRLKSKATNVGNYYKFPSVCQVTGCQNKPEHWHHKDGDRSNNCCLNVVALCGPCHREVHGGFGGWNKGLKQGPAEREMRARATKAGFKRKRLERTKR